MVRYFYAWAPAAVVLGTVVLLTIPYLALIALMVAGLAAAAALAWAIVAVLYTFGRAVSRREVRSSAGPRPAVALSPARRQSA